MENLVSLYVSIGRLMANSARSPGRTLKDVFGGQFPELRKTVSSANAKREMLQLPADVIFQDAALGILEGQHEDSQILENANETINAVLTPDLKGIQTEQVRNRRRLEIKTWQHLV